MASVGTRRAVDDDNDDDAEVPSSLDVVGAADVGRRADEDTDDEADDERIDLEPLFWPCAAELLAGNEEQTDTVVVSLIRLVRLLDLPAIADADNKLDWLVWRELAAVVRPLPPTTSCLMAADCELVLRR